MIKNIFIAAAAIFSLNISAAQAPEKKFDQERYNVIKNAYNPNTNWFKEGFKVQPQDIEMVKLHISKELQPKLDNMQSIFTKIKRVFFGMLSTSFGLPAGLSGLAAVGGAITTPFALKDSYLAIPDQMRDFFQYVPSFITNIVQKATSPSYSNLLKHIYFNTLPSALSGVSPEPQQPSSFLDKDIQGWKNFIRYHMNEEFLYQLRPLDSAKDFAITLGMLAPIAGFAALTLGGIAKLLWNKTRSYQKEIDNLNAQINLDNNMIMALQGKQ